MHQLCRACVFAKRIAARHTQIGQPLVLKQQKQESLTCFIRFYLTENCRQTYTDWTAVSPETTETGVADLFYTVLFNGIYAETI